MHAQARCCIDFNDTAVELFDRFKDAVTDQINAANIQAYHLRCGDSAGSDFWMHVVCDVGGRSASRKVGIIAQDDALAFWWY